MARDPRFATREVDEAPDGRHPEALTVSVARGIGEPAESWWTKAPREGFSATARTEAERMKTSRLGRLVRLHPSNYPVSPA